MNKKWSYEIRYDQHHRYGKFVIEYKDSIYTLLFYEHFGDIAICHRHEDIRKIWECLLSLERLKTENSVYQFNAIKFGIPTDLNLWTEIN